MNCIAAATSSNRALPTGRNGAEPAAEASDGGCLGGPVSRAVGREPLENTSAVPSHHVLVRFARLGNERSMLIAGRVDVLLPRTPAAFD